MLSLAKVKQKHSNNSNKCCRQLKNLLSFDLNNDLCHRSKVELNIDFCKDLFAVSIVPVLGQILLQILFWNQFLRVYSSASRNSIPSRNFQLGISAPFSSWNFQLKISELKFRAEIFWVEIFSSENELKFRAEIFWVEIFSSEKELKFRAEILASQKLWVENFHFFHVHVTSV